MRVFAIETVGEFVGVGLADHTRAGIEETLYARRRSRCRRMGLEPNGIAVAGATSRNVVDILHGHRKTGERAPAAAVKCDVGMTRERVERVVWNHCGLCKVAGWRETVWRPRLKA
jgi:hypothetical protein